MHITTTLLEQSMLQLRGWCPFSDKFNRTVQVEKAISLTLSRLLLSFSPYLK